MNPKYLEDEFLKLLGRFVLDFAAMEFIIFNAGYVLDKSGAFRTKLLLRNNVSNNISIIKKQIIPHYSVNDSTSWIDALDDLSDLFEFRNAIFHNWIIDEGDGIIRRIPARDHQKGAPLPEVDPSDLKNKYDRLMERRRQLMDFIEGSRLGKSICSQRAFPTFQI